MPALISLSRGLYTMIDEEDFDRVSAYTWHASGRYGGFYASRTYQQDSRKISVYLHRFLMDAQPGQEVDHINGDRLDNRRTANLRICTHGQNMANAKGRDYGRSAYKGVSPVTQTGRWAAFIGGHASHEYVGTFNTDVEAAEAYDLAARARYGAFARTNFPPDHISSISAIPVKRVVQAWTTTEDEVLRSHPSTTAASRILGRSIGSCKRRKYRLKHPAEESLGRWEWTRALEEIA